jgi:hypothetical protein
VRGPEGEGRPGRAETRDEMRRDDGRKEEDATTTNKVMQPTAETLDSQCKAQLTANREVNRRKEKKEEESV